MLNDELLKCDLKFYRFGNCLKRLYLSFCLYWIAVCTCPTVRNISSCNDNVSAGGFACLTMNFQNLFSRRKILLKAFNSHMVCYIVINNFLWVLRSVVGLTILHKLLLRLTSKFEKCIQSFIEILIVDFIDSVCTQCSDFTKT